jgi:hypothetical protein
LLLLDSDRAEQNTCVDAEPVSPVVTCTNVAMVMIFVGVEQDTPIPPPAAARPRR